jgi:hypothetical protein
MGPYRTHGLHLILAVSVSYLSISSADHRWVLDARDHPHRAAAFLTGAEVQFENALQALHPSHRPVVMNTQCPGSRSGLTK